MIIIYGITADEKVTLLKEFFTRIELDAKFIDKSVLDYTLKDLVEKDVPFEKIATDETAFLISGDDREEAGGKVLAALAKGQIAFDYQILIEEDNLDKTLEAVIAEHRLYRSFLKKLAYLQQLIDGTKNFKEAECDPDDWSELKLAVANANDYLDSLVNEREAGDKFDEEDNATIELKIQDLKKAMKHLLDRNSK